MATWFIVAAGFRSRPADCAGGPATRQPRIVPPRWGFGRMGDGDHGLTPVAIFRRHFAAREGAGGVPCEQHSLHLLHAQRSISGRAPRRV